MTGWRRFAPVTPATAGDLECFAAAHGTFRWCSCMRWRLRSAPFRDSGKDGRAAALTERVRRYMGTRELYLAAGFDEMPVPDGARPVMRRQLGRTRH